MLSSRVLLVLHLGLASASCPDSLCAVRVFLVLVCVAVLEKDLLRIEAEQQREEADKGRRDATHKLEETYGKLIALAKVRQGLV